MFVHPTLDTEHYFVKFIGDIDKHNQYVSFSSTKLTQIFLESIIWQMYDKKILQIKYLIVPKVNFAAREIYAEIILQYY